MARPWPTTNGTKPSNVGAPPPSTLAAQIVQNQTQSVAAAQQQGDTATFPRLLHELLRNPTVTQETDLATNVKLIDVVSEAGLGPLADENPFDLRADALIPQARDSILVIRATIERQPEVLFSEVKPDGPQLALPLLARLIAVCGREHCDDLPVRQLLEAIFRAVEVSLNLWTRSGELRNVLEECIDDVIAALHPQHSSISGLAVKLPPMRSITRLWPQTQNAIALPLHCQATITKPAHAFVLASQLNSIVALSSQFRKDAWTRLQRTSEYTRPMLQHNGQVEKTLLDLLSSRDQAMVCTGLICAIPEAMSSSSVQNSVERSLSAMSTTDPGFVRDHLTPSLVLAIQSVAFDSLDEGLKLTLLSRVAFFCADRPMVADLITKIKCGLSEDDCELLGGKIAALRRYVSVENDFQDDEKRVKRRRLNAKEPSNAGNWYARRLSHLLTGAESDALADLPGLAIRNFPGLTERDQCAVWQALADLMSVEPAIALRTVSQLHGQRDLHLSNRSRVCYLTTIHECVRQTSDPTYMDLQSSPLALHCLKSLHSSLRDVRVAAGKCLPAFLRSDLPADLVSNNRRAALEYLRTLSERASLSEQESLVSIWANVALSCGEKELNLALLRLVDYLGHPNPLISGLAFIEIEQIATARHQDVEELCKPFWGSIAVSVVQDLQSRPQKARQLCDLLGMELNQFLLLTQQDTVPSLVLTKRKDVLQRIATARGKGATVQDVCLQPKTNLAGTVALFLVRYGPDAEDAAIACLSEVAPGFQDTDLASLIKMYPTLIACNILKFIGDQPESGRWKGYQGFQLFAVLSERGSGHSKSHSKSSRAITDFFDSHILGIMTDFSQILEDAQGIQSNVEKILCLKAISQMILFAKREIGSALPQIRACLQSAMDQPPLCEAAFSAWLSLLSVLESDDIALVVDQTFALILQHWSSLSPDLQQATHEKVAQLIKDHNQVVQESVMTLPDIGSIPLLSKFAAEIERLKSQRDVASHFAAFARRLGDESKTVVMRAARELVPFLENNQAFVHDIAVSEQPAAVLSNLVRVLLDATAKYSLDDEHAADIFGKALGIIGCLDPNRVEAIRKKRSKVVLSNFEKASEVVDWTLILLEDVLVNVFRSVNNSRAQGFVAFVIQELLRFCGFNDPNALRARSSQAPTLNQRFSDLPEHVRITLTPLISSHYVVTTNNANPPNRAYPSFTAASGHGTWLRQLVYDLMWKAKGDNARMVFPLLARLIRGHDLAIANFMLPYTTMNVVLGGTVAEVKGISDELLAVLNYQPANSAEQETVKSCSESVFAALDYMSTWLREKKKLLSEIRTNSIRTGHSPAEFDEIKDMDQIKNVEKFLASVPAELIATRATLCGSYARALLHWEQHIRQGRPLIPSAKSFQRNTHDSSLYDQLQHIYAQIDEPDGLEGISANLTFLSEEQQAIQHAKAGRWTAAQTWYEIQLAKSPDNIDVEKHLLGCLRETGRYDPLLRYADSFSQARSARSVPNSAADDVRELLPITLEAHWMSGDLEGMSKRLEVAASPATATATATATHDFNTGIASMLESVVRHNDAAFSDTLSSLRRQTTQAATVATTSSIQASHEDLRKLHVLYELEALRKGNMSTALMNKRLDVLGSYVTDKQYVLGVRRAIMNAQRSHVGLSDIGASWLTTAKLARQSGNTESAHSAVLRAYECGIRGAKLEEARLMWRDGHQRHAIQALEAAINSGIFDVPETETNQLTEETQQSNHKQNDLAAKAHLLLAKWLDASGQRQAKEMTEKYQYAARHFQRWEKGHYYLGKHYQKLLEAEIALPATKQSQAYITGDITRLVIENQTRSIAFGNKYWHQTIPKVFTLWLDLGVDCMAKPRGDDKFWLEQRPKALQAVNRTLSKYFDRVPPYVFYSALPQLLSRITHPHPDVWKMLSNLLVKIAATYPNQALWSFLAVVKATDTTRVERGWEILKRLKDPKNRTKSGTGPADLRVFLAHAQKLSDGLLNACEAQVKDRTREVSLSRDLGFSHKLAPSQLVVPIELTLTANGPTNANCDTIRQHKPFVQERITIESFLDDVLVLNSLQRPRKLTVRGSDGKLYGLLCKPRDDLRKDQRLMEFNGVINRALKRDAESSKRRLYIKTYAVTPLSEESGTIEWVEGIKPMRDILLSNYARRGIRPNYQELRSFLNDACAAPENLHMFKDKVLAMHPACLHEWFAEVFPEPEMWFAARLRYARSAAVMSITGHVLGLGDRHGENILLEEGGGGVFHVDFNCLFDKGLTFEKPELVPFRLTHNMVDAMGPYGYEGPFRKSCELTLRLLRQSKDTLNTVLETFLYDPTTDFVGKKKRTTPGVPETPPEILDSVDSKLRGLLRGETVPLSVEGYVDVLIRQATDHFNLASMYIGWCAFL